MLTTHTIRVYSIGIEYASIETVTIQKQVNVNR